MPRNKKGPLSKFSECLTGIIVVEIQVSEKDCLNLQFGILSSNFKSKRLRFAFDYLISESIKIKTFPCLPLNSELSELGTLGSNIVVNIGQIEGIEAIQIGPDGLSVFIKDINSGDKLSPLITEAIRKANCEFCQELRKK